MPNTAKTPEELAAVVLPAAAVTDPERVAFALATASEVLRTINHATLRTTSAMLASPADLYSVFAALSELAARQVQLYAQLGAWGVSLANDPALRSTGQRDRDGGIGTAHAMAAMLVEASNTAGAMKGQLEAAHGLQGALYRDEE